MAQDRLPGLEVVPGLLQLSSVSVADRDHEVVADEEVDLAGLDGVVLVDVPERLDRQEQAALVELELGALMGVHGVLDGERVQIEGDRDVVELVLVRLVQTHPHEVLLAALSG